jgi:hypothetical protein
MLFSVVFLQWRNLKIALCTEHYSRSLQLVGHVNLVLLGTNSENTTK